MKKIFVSGLLLLTFISSSYADVYHVNIVKVAVRKDESVYFNTDPAPSSRPGCATNSWHYAFKVNSDAGKGMLSLAITAHTTKALIGVQSLGTCDTYHNMEDVDYIILEEK